MNSINSQLGLNTNFSNAEGLKWNYPASETKCPKGMIPYGDGSACKDRSTTCASSGNVGMVRCEGFVSKDPIKCTGNRILLANGGCRDVAPTAPTDSTDTTDTTDTTNTKNSEESNKGLSMGAKIGIGVGALALVVVSVIALKRRK